MRWRGQPLDASGVAAMYAPLLSGIVATEPAAELPTLETDTLMDTPDRRRRLAEQALSFALELA